MSLIIDERRERWPTHRRWLTASVAAHLFTLVLFAFWWVYSRYVPVYQVPGPELVLTRMFEFVTTPELRLQLGISLAHVVTAMVISITSGAALAFLAHYIPAFRLLVDSRITPLLNAFSGIGWIFLAILWFGINSATVIFAVSMVLVPFAIINFRTGLREMDNDLIELGRSLTANRWRQFLKLTIPMLVPYIFATLRTSFGVAWKVVLTAELFGGSSGVGYLLNAARQEFETETIFAIIMFIIVFVASAEVFLFRPIQRRLDKRYADA